MPNEARTRAYYAMRLMGQYSMVHKQFRTARENARDEVNPMIDKMVDKFSPVREVYLTAQENKNRVEKFENDKQKEAIRKELMWESTVSKNQKAYRAEVDAAEVEKAHEQAAIRAKYEERRWIIAGMQSAYIVGGAIAGAAPVSLEAPTKLLQYRY